MNATDAQNNFGKMLEDAQHEPVVITRRGRTSAYVISAKLFEEFKEFRKQRKIEKLRKVLAEGSTQAEKGEFSHATAEDILKQARNAVDEQQKSKL